MKLRLHKCLTLVLAQGLQHRWLQKEIVQSSNPSDKDIHQSGWKELPSL
ncbi:MAG: hypothetical protein CM15mP120_01190 [Pseudomonadota bacterium]|nr:MAG: hypothetical protein CM15mP120_01190 [Pseudomonadota bacterium]